MVQAGSLAVIHLSLMRRWRRGAAVGGMPSQGLQVAPHSEGLGLAPSFPAPTNERRAGSEEGRALQLPDLRTDCVKAEPGIWPYPAV